MSEQRNRITDALMRFFLPRSHDAMRNAPPEPRGAPNPFTPPLWRDPLNTDDPLMRPQPWRGLPRGVDPRSLEQRQPYSPSREVNPDELMQQLPYRRGEVQPNELMAANKPPSPSPYPKPGTPWPTPRGGPILPPLPWQPPDWT